MSAAQPSHVPGPLESALRRRRDAGGKSLVPYITGGLGEWIPTIEAVAQAGADAIEIGIPFSDPVMDGPPSRRPPTWPCTRGPFPTR